MLWTDIYKYSKKCIAEDYSTVLINFRVGGLSRAFNVWKREEMIYSIKFAGGLN